MGRLRKLGMKLAFDRIREIDTAERFFGVQQQLGEAARKVDVPRVWFDDNWGDRESTPRSNGGPTPAEEPL
jgi:hypothetical protein